MPRLRWPVTPLGVGQGACDSRRPRHGLGEPAAPPAPSAVHGLPGHACAAGGAVGASAASIGDRFTGLLVRDAPDAVVLWPKPAGTIGGAALSVLMAYAEGLARRFAATVTVTWVQAGITTSNGRLFCSSWWVAGPNTNRPLRPAVVSGKGGRSACSAFGCAPGFPSEPRRVAPRTAGRVTVGFGGAPGPDGGDRPVPIPVDPSRGR